MVMCMNRKGDMWIGFLFFIFIISVMAGYLIYNENNVEGMNTVDFVNSIDSNTESIVLAFEKPVYDGGDFNYMINMTIHSFVYMFKNMIIMALGTGVSVGSDIDNGQYNAISVILLIILLFGAFILLATPVAMLYFVIKDIYNEVKKKYFKKK